MQELRSALLTDEIPNFAGCGHAWRVQLEACMNGRGSHHSLVSVWEELKGAIKAWLVSAIQRVGAQVVGEGGPCGGRRLCAMLPRLAAAEAQRAPPACLSSYHTKQSSRLSAPFPFS